jgi:outer membrane protein OmpA-like peptidoglycan-associated protein
VRIEGHTDSQGKREANLKLSQDRANAVLDHLVTVQHVESGRLEAKGFGPDVPVADNKTSAGRARNRRSVFIVAQRKGQTAP